MADYISKHDAYTTLKDFEENYCYNCGARMDLKDSGAE